MNENTTEPRYPLSIYKMLKYIHKTFLPDETRRKKSVHELIYDLFIWASMQRLNGLITSEIEWIKSH